MKALKPLLRGLRFRIWGLGFGGLGFRVWGLGVQASKVCCKLQCSCTVRTQGLGFGDSGLETWVQYLP